MIEVSNRPTSIGTHRYDVRAAGRSTHGFRTSPQAAREAAKEDENLMYFAARSSANEEDKAEPMAHRRTTRRESVTRSA